MRARKKLPLGERVKVSPDGCGRNIQGIGDVIDIDSALLDNKLENSR
jgi:hypothetical protein